jgi:mono/diheme cytochrome c family protein
VKAPILLKIGLLTVSATAFYTYVGQLVPQKEVQPPQEMQMAADMSTADLVGAGKEIFDGKGMCLTCHTIGRSGALRFPDLGGIGSRAGQRVPGLSDLQYLAQSLYHPEAFIVPGFTPGMPVINRPPIALSDQEIRAVIAYLQSLGGTATVTMQTAIPFAEGGSGSTGGAGVAAEQAAAADGAGVPVPAAAPVASGPRDAQRLLDDYQCASCHRLDAPGRLQASSLADIGSRMAEAQITGALAAHPPFAAGADFAEVVTVAELRSLARYLSTLRGTDA